MNKKNLLLLATLISLASAYALDFDVSPNPNGSLDVNASQTFAWGESLWSSVSLSVENPLAVDDDDAYYVATSGTSVEASVDILGFRFSGPAGFGMALNLLYNPSDLKEVGYIDLVDGSRLFLVNDRHIELILPRLKTSLSANAGPLKLSIEGEVAPWYMVTLTQTLSTSTSGVPVEKTLSSPGTGNWAYSADAVLVINNSVLTPELRFGFDSVPIAYAYLDALGTESYLDSLIFNVRAMAGGSIDFLRFSGAAPRVLVGYEWNRVQNRATGEWIVDGGDYLLLLGFSM